MRKVIGLKGEDNTSAAFAWMQATRQREKATLFAIGALDHPNRILVTDYGIPLTWGPGTFACGDPIKHAAVPCKIGLDVASIDVTWSPRNTTVTQSIATASPYQLAHLGYYDNWPIRIWKPVMPTPGDCQTYGCFEVFGGRIASVTVDRLKIVFHVNSWLECLQMKIPANVIENTNVLASYAGAKPPAGFSTIPRFSVAAGSSDTVLLLDCTSTPGHIFGTNVFQRGWLLWDFPSGTNPNETLGGIWGIVGGNSDYIDGGGMHHNKVQIYSQLPWPPTPGSDTCFISAPFPVDQAEGTIGTDNYPFPYVPSPETAA